MKRSEVFADNCASPGFDTYCEKGNGPEGSLLIRSLFAVYGELPITSGHPHSASFYLWHHALPAFQPSCQNSLTKAQRQF